MPKNREIHVAYYSKGRMLHITPFVGAQVDICEAFGIDISDGCAPRYRSRQAQPKHRGRPRKQKIEKPDS